VSAAAAGETDLAAQAAASLRHPLTLALLALTFTTGLIDAASYLGLGHVFTANMTGNVVLLGFGVAGAAGLPVISPLVSLAAFLVGGVAGGRLVRRTADHGARLLSWTLSIEVALVTAGALFAALVDVHPDAFSGDVVVAVLAFAMGVRNAAVRRIGVPDLTTTVLTMTLTGLAADSRLAGGSGAGSARRCAAFAAMLVGALAGALLVRVSVALALVTAASLALATALGIALVTRLSAAI
jgi:uncharacterized membrane protein YoaK (UPF0700 family)